MDINVFDHYETHYEAVKLPARDGVIHNHIAITQGDARVNVWLNETQAQELRRALDALYPSSDTEEQEALERYADEHVEALDHAEPNTPHAPMDNLSRHAFDTCANMLRVQLEQMKGGTS